MLSYSINVGGAGLETIDGQITGFAKKTKEPSSFGVGGVGLTYFLTEDAPSLFVDLAGAGYEFKKNWTAEVDYSFGSPSDDESLFGEKFLEAEVTGATLGVTINHIWY